MIEPICCTPKSLPPQHWVAAAATARSINPTNHPLVHMLAWAFPRTPIQPEHIAVLTTKWWGSKGKDFSVGFMDNPPADLRARILLHMNAWSKTANVSFRESNTDPIVRIARESGGGYYSYLGTDILHIPANEQTLNLDSFTMNTPDSEFYRVVRHETGHTLGCPHEHMRKELVDLIDPVKAIAYFKRTQGWSRKEILAQVLTPISETNFVLATPHAVQNSIMCYEIPGSITKNGKPIIGGTDIIESDYSVLGTVYPKSVAA